MVVSLPDVYAADIISLQIKKSCILQITADNS